MIKKKDITEKKEAAAQPKKRVKKTIEPEIVAAIPDALPDAAKLASVKDETADMPEGMGQADVSEEDSDGKGKKPDRYFEGVGRRKTAVARVRLFTKTGDFRVNEKLHTEFFKTFDQQKIAEEALQKMKLFGRFRVSAKVNGGGSHAQAEAVRHGLARCLIKFNPDFRKRLKRADFLKRDPRMKERKKFGLKKARRAPQWAKR